MMVLTSETDAAAIAGLEKTPTGNSWLDQITGGGLPRGRVTLVTGGPGAGKTLLGLKVLVADGLNHRRRELRRSVMERKAHLLAVQDQHHAERAELHRVGLRGRHDAAAAEADRSAMETRRCGDVASGSGEWP